MDTTKVGVDMASVGVVVATLIDWLPEVAALLSIIWTTLRIIEILCNWGWILCKKEDKT